LPSTKAKKIMAGELTTGIYLMKRTNSVFEPLKLVVEYISILTAKG